MGKRGPLPGTGGRPRKALAEKVMDGRTSHRKTEIMNLNPTAASLTGHTVPEPKKFLLEDQKVGIELEAKKIYEDTWEWINKNGGASLINPFLVQQYAMASARWIQCERAVSLFGFLAKHPTTGQAMRSPYVSMASDYLHQSNRLWAEIFGILKANSMMEFNGTNPHDDMMERLLTVGKGG